MAAIFYLLVFSCALIAGEEPLLSVRAHRSGVDFGVMSTGCTEKKDFALDVTQLTAPPRVRLLRAHADPCESTSHEVIISYSYRELGIMPGENFQINGESFTITISPNQWW